MASQNDHSATTLTAIPRLDGLTYGIERPGSDITASGANVRKMMKCSLRPAARKAETRGGMAIPKA